MAENISPTASLDVPLPDLHQIVASRLAAISALEPGQALEADESLYDRGDLYRLLGEDLHRVAEKAREGTSSLLHRDDRRTLANQAQRATVIVMTVIIVLLAGAIDLTLGASLLALSVASYGAVKLAERRRPQPAEELSVESLTSEVAPVEPDIQSELIGHWDTLTAAIQNYSSITPETPVSANVLDASVRLQNAVLQFDQAAQYDQLAASGETAADAARRLTGAVANDPGAARADPLAEFDDHSAPLVDPTTYQRPEKARTSFGQLRAALDTLAVENIANGGDGSKLRIIANALRDPTKPPGRSGR